MEGLLLLVSVILTSYNKAKYLTQAIESVLGQTYKDLELLVVDDHSTDKSFTLIDKYAQIDKRVIPIKSDLGADHNIIQCNRYAHNINYAFRLSHGQLITYLCDDDYYMPDRCGRMVDFLDSNPEISVCYGRQAMVDDSTGTRQELGTRPSPEVVADAVCVVDHSSVMHRRKVFVEANGWNESYFTWRMGDAGFWRRVQKAGYQFHLVPGEYTDVHRYNELSVSYAIDHGIGPEVKQ
jgi:spore maturation protein CgeD